MKSNKNLCKELKKVKLFYVIRKKKNIKKRGEKEREKIY